MAGNVPYKVPVGPIHPALKEPVHIELTVLGEEVIGADFTPGQTHRGIEWMGLHRNPVQIVHLTDRICGICGVTHSLCFARAVEQIADINAPERADYVRTIIAEFERIQSHLLWAGVAAHELGFDSLFYLAWRVREDALDAIEVITGNRVNYDIIQIGGVRRDITADMLPKIRKCLDSYKELFSKLQKLFLEDAVIKARCKGCGVLTKETAAAYSTVGPTSRASGLPADLRVDYPYCAYGDLKISPVLPSAYGKNADGDTYDRIVVRIFEIAQSIEIIEECLANMPEGPVLYEEKVAKILALCKKASGEAVGRHEAPRGEALHYVAMGNAEAPVAWKVKASSYSNLHVWPVILKGVQLADIPIVVASVDPCLSCTDRVAVTTEAGSTKILTKEMLSKMSYLKTRRMME
ncbi:MAG TPA: nickel-dependent hydrogenase large subunit [Methanocorpusculum sp.]|nr:nickel-dependent hydrogenase large subunit [Methanocorpusculum sp.]HJJ40210.1 nickel-dependent hydrogenase large subunit [Methanocorpusculum sp.]HJJ49599.1 nickel-dependent hydrogenase large subunit [Methanocorpusculum sp.]HJJ57684.1 nickel-dependent hydrogenase large subunit [Methanocorpusculum sp.]HJJ95764.1 nickel-dependent hydrogenase large subunit [Methanocorpusculum sp.]